MPEAKPSGRLARNAIAKVPATADNAVAIYIAL